MPSCLPFLLLLQPVPETSLRSYVLAPGAQVQLTRPLQQTSLRLEDGHLVLQSQSGGPLLLLEFTASSLSPCGITFITPEGDTLRGSDILQVFGKPQNP